MREFCAYCDNRHGTMATVEVIRSVERRRRWSREAKVRIVAESARPDCTVSQVARAHDIAPGQLFTWRRELLAAAIESHGSEGDRGDSGFVPVRTASSAVAAGAPACGVRSLAAAKAGSPECQRGNGQLVL